MTTKEIAFKLEDLQNESEKIYSLQLAIFSAIYEGNNSCADYEYAFIVLGDLSLSLKEDLARIRDAGFELMRKGAA